MNETKNITAGQSDNGAGGRLEILKDPEKAARYYLLNEHSSPLNAVFYEAGLKSEMLYHEDIENAFIAGAKWNRERMLLGAVEGEIRGDIRSQEEEPFQIWAESDFLPLDWEFKLYDKVKLIIVKED